MIIKVVSFNIRCCDDENKNKIKDRAPRLSKVILNYSPDLIGIQEFRLPWQKYFDKYFLNDYEIYSFSRSTDGVYESVPILWRKRRFECIKRGTFWLSDTPEYESRGWDEVYDVNRICSYVILKDKITSNQFAFMNTHFGLGDLCQKKSSELIYKYSKLISDYPTVITGDFNMTPDSVGYLEMKKYFTDINGVTSKDYSPTYHGYDPEDNNGSHIDYCFINGYFRPIDHKIIKDTVRGKYPSDHYGIYSEIEIQKNLL
ncbi:MAG: hypothetical protein E7574_03175 [Ruminococcaceae bacterium]|nr:hypothetical protein [Oscillospiraceae bacterium]